MADKEIVNKSPSESSAFDKKSLLNVLTAAKKGDFSVRMPEDWTGINGKIADTLNEIIDQNEKMDNELDRVSRVVGQEGKINQRAKIGIAEGSWMKMENSLNLLINEMVRPLNEMATVIGAVAKGDLSQSISMEVEGQPRQGEIKRIAMTVNKMVEQLGNFTLEVTRVAKEVGIDGKLGGQAKIKGVSGIWKELTESVNSMASNLTAQVRNIADVTTAVAKGDLTKKITVEAKGEIFELKNTVNIMVDQLSSFGSEVTRVAREVGTDGKLGGQAKVEGVSGTWKDLTESVNFMASNLTNQVRNIADVTTAVAKGDLARKITVDAKGEILELKNTINTMVDQLSSFGAEVTRVAREVGTDGKLGGQANVKGVSGTWKDLTESVNSMASNLTNQVRNIANVTTAVAKGDLARKITVEAKGEIQELKNTINTMVDQLSSFGSEVTRVAREVGTEGKLGGQAKVKGVSGTWQALTESVNSMASNLTNQVRNIADVTTAVAKGDLTKKITVEAMGEILQLKNTINTMVDQLSSFASEVTRVAREVGTDGKLGGQAKVEGVAGTWRDLTESVNFMASNLTNQVRNIANVTTAVAKGDLNRKITVDAKGEILELKNTINIMVDQLSSFGAEVTRVAREVGTDGKLGGQAKVEGISGTWKDLTESVNYMALNLTNQVRNIADVTTAVAKGDLARKITVDARGEILELKNTINIMVDQLSSFGAEVTRVAREVGTDGKLGGQAKVEGVAGTWKDLTESVNSMASNLTNQVRNIANVTIAVAKGDLAKKITVDASGEFLELKDTINIMVDQLGSFAAEVTRVAREVGTDGKLGGQAQVEGVAGTWKDLTESVNYMATNLTNQVRNIADVTTAVAKGDLTKKITVEAMGEILQLKNTINIMVDQLGAFASEVTRVAREVGTDGKLGGQAKVGDVSGTWKDLTESVNSMASNLTNQVRNIADVTTAVAKGDLARKITVEALGEILELKNTINTMVDQLSSFASEVTRVAREVGTDGKLGGQARVEGVAGTWRDLTESVNYMASNLTNQVRNIAEVTTAVAKGDLNRKITVEAMGEILELKNTINIMVDQLSSFAAEVTRVAREVGTDGKLGGQARVEGVAGTWKDLTESVNYMASNLTNQVRNIADVTTAVAKGDLNRKITVEARGEILELKNTINVMVDQLNSFGSEVTRVAREVGTDGKLGGQAKVEGVSGTWRDLTESVNYMASNLTNQVRNIADVTTAVAKGDLARKITVEAKGEIFELKNTINIMVDQLNAFAAEVTRVAREVGTDGKLGGQAKVPGVAGTWKDLTDNVNTMAANLTDQVRGIAKIVTAVAEGKLKQKLTLQAKGEIASLSETINSMIDTLATFADQVTNVAREVGVEGRLGGQAVVPGTAGIWKDLTDNVNQLAANLTSQVRAIAEVATAVTKGDLSRTIRVEARGELEELKNNLNEMIRNLQDTTQKNSEQDWLKTNLARFTRLLQGQRDLEAASKLVLSELAPLVAAQHGLIYLMETSDDNAAEPTLRLMTSYAFKERKNISNQIKIGEGLVGQCAYEKQRILLSNVPGDYIQISSGLGEAPPLNIIVLPVLFENQVKAAIELASFNRFSPTHQAFLDQLTESIGIVFNTIQTSMRTEDLLKKSQSMAEELQSQQEELQQTNEELEEKARLLSAQKQDVERKNLEVEQAKQALEEKATQLTLTSKYKSEFLSNMSHELRTPLNSLLILSNQLQDNSEGNLTEKQVQFARTIQSSGNDLLTLINDILDLSKIEAGKTTLDLSPVFITDLRDRIENNFRHVAENKGLKFSVDVDPKTTPAISTDYNRLEQILKNLLSNAFKFTEKGGVELRIAPAESGWSRDNEILNSASRVIGFAVQDTGIGIAPEKQRAIFEAFQQADGSTSRKYGGTGLGLTISREIAKLLGGEIRLSSVLGKGSTFLLYMPEKYLPPDKSEQGNTMETLESEPVPRKSAQVPKSEPVNTDHERETVKAGERVLLIIEDDSYFADILLDIAQEKGFKAIIAKTGKSGLTLARQYRPDAILLDINLPDIDGWQVLEKLKSNPLTSRIQVHVITVEEDREMGLRQGALTHLIKPVSREMIDQVLDRIGELGGRPNKLLLIDDNESFRRKLAQSLGGEDISVTEVDSKDALATIQSESFDCIIVEKALSDRSGLDLIEEISTQPGLPNIPFILHGEKTLTRKEVNRLKKLALSLILKDASTLEHLQQQVSLFLHEIKAKTALESMLPSRQTIEPDGVLIGKKVLLVDDDIRNTFAMTGALERYKLDVLTAENGQEAINALKKNPEIDIILMDIMMPEMDGYDTTRAIRKMAKFKTLPIIALTAKAMKGDREKCLEAGFNEYITKPVNIEQLAALMRAWLYS